MTRIVHIRNEPLENYKGIKALLSEIQNHNGVIETIDNIQEATQLFKTEGERLMVIATNTLLLGVATEKAQLQADAYDYIRKGGTVLAVWPFDFDGDDVDRFFKIFDLPWQSSAEISNAPFVLNQPRFQQFDTLHLANRVDMRCGSMNNVEARDCLYVRNEAGGMDAQLYIADPDLRLDKVAMAFTGIKDGKFGYIGNDLEHQESIEVVPIRTPNSEPNGLMDKRDPQTAMTYETRIIHLRREPLRGKHGHSVTAAIIEEIASRGGKIDRIDNFISAMSLFTEEETLPTVLATDTMLLKDDQLRAAAKKYIQKGGTIVAIWPIYAPQEDTDKFFEEFDLPWRCGGDLYRAGFELNPLFNQFDTSRLADYDVRCYLLKGVRTRDCVYAKARVASLQDFPMLFAEEETQDEVAAAFNRLGEGSFGYVGDEGNERETIDMVLALVGLL